MATQLGNNVNVCAIKGNFDDAQSGVKKIFSDNDMARRLESKGYILSSANSINWGRLAPQIVYYVSAYCDLLREGRIGFGEKINVCVPTGNFGNIFAAYIAREMGLPIGKLICASNQNNVLTDFFNRGEYNRQREFHTTMSPSMDILISSNLERLLYFTAGPGATAELMDKLKKEGKYSVDASIMQTISKDFRGYYADERATADTIKSCYEINGKLIDTHTAVAMHCAKRYISESRDDSVTVVASTASPYKFAADVYASIKGKKPTDDLAALEMLSNETKTEIPYPLKDVASREIRFKETIDVSDMAEKVLEFAQ
jgi:threonine synthase